MTAYTVVIDRSGTYAVEIRSDNGPAEVVGGFRTEAEANDYMQERLRHDDPGNDFA